MCLERQRVRYTPAGIYRPLSAAELARSISLVGGVGGRCASTLWPCWTRHRVQLYFFSSALSLFKKKSRFCVNHRCGKMFSNFAARTLIRYRRCLCFSHAWRLLEKGKRVLWSDFETVLLCDAIALYELLSRGLFCFNQRVVFNIVKLLKLRKILCFINVGLYEILQRLI